MLISEIREGDILEYFSHIAKRKRRDPILMVMSVHVRPNQTSLETLGEYDGWSKVFTHHLIQDNPESLDWLKRIIRNGEVLWSHPRVKE